jgi:ankyrin repeat protein
MPMDTELHKACRDKELEAVKELVKGGEDVDALGAQGRTPLQRALGAGAADICEFLLEHSADPLIIDAMKRSSLHWAAMAPEGAVASVQLLFKFGLGAGMLDKQSKSGSTALIMATEQGKVAVIELLLSLGADRALRDEDGKAAIDFCAKNKELLELFKKDPKNKKQDRVRRRSSLIQAMSRRRSSVLRSLRRNSASVSPP